LVHCFADVQPSRAGRSHETLKAVSHFIQHNPLPPGVASELRAYFNVNAQQQRASLSLAEQKDIYRNLPLSLQVEVARIVSRDSLLSVQIFENTSDYFLVRTDTAPVGVPSVATLWTICCARAGLDRELAGR
jgi:hypothetical protein